MQSRELLTSRDASSCLILSLVINFGILGIFKYFNFFIGSFAHAVHSLTGIEHVHHFLENHPASRNFVLHVSRVAYIVDVYHRKIEPADSFIQYSLFISLFPHLIAGPIQRPDHSAATSPKAAFLGRDKALDGMILIAEGLSGKCVIADNCALIANAAFGGEVRAT